MSRVCESDGSLGPGVGLCRGSFDFTLMFQDGVLGLLPQAALLLLACIRLAILRRRKRRVVKKSYISFLKMGTGVCYVASTIALLVTWGVITNFKTKLTIPSASLEFLGSLFIVTLSWLEHSKALRPSHLLQFFLMILLLCDVVHLRTLFLMRYPISLVTLATIHTFLTGLLLFFESLSKRQLFSSENDRRLPPEETIGLFGKRTFWHLNSMFQEGYRKILQPADLFSMDADLASKERMVTFQNTWADQKKTQRMPLIRTIVKVFWLELLLPIIPRAIQMATTLTQPYLITAMIKFIQDRHKSSNNNIGYGLIAAFALNYTVLAISTGWYSQSVTRFLTKLRGCLVSAIYDRTLISSTRDVESGAATVLMNVDVERLLNGLNRVNEVWVAFPNMAVALYILYTHIGGAFIAPFLTILITASLSAWLGGSTKLRQQIYADATERRVTTISYVAGRMKEVRMLGLSETVLQLLTKLRVVEIAAQTYIWRLLVWIMLFSNSTFQLSTVSTYTAFTVIILVGGDQKTLDFNRLYGSLSALKLVAFPLTTLLQVIPLLQISYASLERLELYLKVDSVPHSSATESTSSLMIEATELSSSRSDHPQGFTISMEKANFAIDKNHLLFDLTTHCHSGTFTVVLGRVGSGKSVFLRSLVGETELLSGHFLPSSAGSAFCDQQVWLRNATIRENIIGEHPLDEVCYRKVLWSCCLFQDLREMKQADHTIIGSNGISLSGGQKNRISLARALYARKHVSIIDDMLAGLDSATEKLVFDRVFGRSGFFRTYNTTVVLATHATHYARHADKIVVISDGRIVEEGRYQELMRSESIFQDLCGSIAWESSVQSVLEDSVSISEDSMELTGPVSHMADVEEQDASRQSGDRQSFFYFVKSVGALHMSLNWGFLAVGIVLTQIQYLWLKWWAESDDKSRSGTIRQLYIFIIVTAANILAYLVYFVHFSMWFKPKASLNMHASQLFALMRANFSCLVSMDIGSITNRFSQDIMLVDLQLPNAWLNVTFEILELICSITIMAIATPAIAACAPVIGAICYYIQKVYLRTSRQIRLMDLEAKAPLCTHFLETLAGIVTVRAFGWASAYRKRNDALLEKSQIPFYMLASIQNWLVLVLELMAAGLVTSIVGTAVGLRSKVDPGYLGLALVSAMDIGFIFQVLITHWTEFEISLSAVGRIRKFSGTPPEEQSVSPIDPPSQWPKNGSILFQDFTASYNDGDKSVVEDINLSIKTGEKIGICGRTGSGKSSLAATLFGLLHQQEGYILLDGVPTTDVSLSTLRSKIIALPQEPFFLKGTVRYNLAPWNPEENRSSVSDEQMENALQQVQLLEKLSNEAEAGQSALDLDLDNVETLLSQGERQLFCLARAILMDGEIAVLDEATSSVDAQTDALMQQVLRTAFANRTIIVIAHRLNTILDFDRVFVMDAGKIVEIGEPSALLKTEGSLFKCLMDGQSDT